MNNSELYSMCCEIAGLPYMQGSISTNSTRCESKIFGGGQGAVPTCDGDEVVGLGLSPVMCPQQEGLLSGGRTGLLNQQQCPLRVSNTRHESEYLQIVTSAYKIHVSFVSDICTLPYL